jgi:phosphate uptake regulator
MEARSLVQHGPATLMVSLPAKWLKKNNLSKGDEINVEEKGEELVLKSQGKKIKKQIELKLTSILESSIRNVLTNCYRLGYDHITLKFNNKEVLEIIKDIIKNNLIGFEIIKRGEKECIIENITEPTQDQFENIYSKIILNIEDLYVIFEQALDGKYSNFDSSEKQIQAFDNFCRRVISKKLESDNQLNWTFQAELGHAQREVYFALTFIQKNKIKSEVYSKLLSDSKKMFNLLNEAYKKRDIALLENIHEVYQDISKKKANEYFKKSKKGEELIIHHLLASIRNYYLASSPLMGMIMRN